MSRKVRITDEDSYGDKKVTIFETEMLSEQASLAFILLEKWGPICAVPDGEDSSGRAQIRPLTPDETVERAFDISEKAFAMARRRNLLIEVPDLNEINKDSDAERAAKKSKERQTA